MVAKTTSQISLRALRVFCAAAKQESFKLAAEELFVTASAVSHQVKLLEEELGVVLFNRNRSGLSLTSAGQSLFEEVDPLLRQLTAITQRFRNRHQRQTLRISVQPFFASELFVPRLAEFTSQNPEIDMQIDTIDEASEKHPSNADVSIRIFAKAPPHLVAEAFYPLRVIPACAPAVREEILEDGVIKPFTRIIHDRRREQWQLWVDASGTRLPDSSSVIELNSTVAVVNAARQRLGVAMIPMPLSQKLFDSGDLTPLYDFEAPTRDRYYFVYPPELKANPAVRALRAWVLSELRPASTETLPAGAGSAPR